MKGLTRKKPTRKQIEDENANLRDALEQIADILEEVGVLEPADPDFDQENDDEPDDPDFDQKNDDEPGDPDIIQGEAKDFDRTISVFQLPEEPKEK